jgi:hypothetical protein
MAILAVHVAGIFGVTYTNDLTLLGIGFGLVSFGFGGALGAMPDYASYCFGLRRIASNYGLVLLGQGFADLVGPFFIGLVSAIAGTCAAAIESAAIVLAVAMIFPIIAEKARSKGLPFWAKASQVKTA